MESPSARASGNALALPATVEASDRGGGKAWSLFGWRPRAGSGTVNPVGVAAAEEEEADALAHAHGLAADAGLPALTGRTLAEVGSLQVLSQRVAFLLSPAQPGGGAVQCYVRRRKKGLNHLGYPTFELFLKEGDQFLLAARKRKKERKKGTYLIATDRSSIKRSGPAYFGKVNANLKGTEFVVLDAGVKPEHAAKHPGAELRRRLAAVHYHRSLRGSRAARKMKVVLPPPPAAAASEGGGQHARVVGTLEEAPDEAGAVELKNRPLRWDDKLAAYVTVVNGFVTKASKKNFSVCPTAAPDDEPTMQFSRLHDSNIFTLDYRWPFCAMQAFGVALSSFEASNKARPSVKKAGLRRRRRALTVKLPSAPTGALQSTAL